MAKYCPIADKICDCTERCDAEPTPRIPCVDCGCRTLPRQLDDAGRCDLCAYAHRLNMGGDDHDVQEIMREQERWIP